MCLHFVPLLGKVCGKIYKSRMYVEKHKKKHIDKKEMSGKQRKLVVRARKMCLHSVPFGEM